MFKPGTLISCTWPLLESEQLERMGVSSPANHVSISIAQQNGYQVLPSKSIPTAFIIQLQSREAKGGSAFLPGRVLLQFGARSRRRARRVRFWARCLAQCEVAKPSVVVEFILVVEIGKLLKIDLVAENGSDATKACSS